MKTCEVGLFKLPGIVFEQGQLTEQQISDIVKWSEETHCGKQMSNTLWSFKNEKQRDMFLLRWSSELQ